MTNRRRRNSLQVKIDLIDAVGKSLRKYGHTRLGINIISQEAGIEKATIYRHFNDFNHLLQSYVEKQDFWLLKLKEYGENEITDYRTFLKYLLTEQFETLYKNEELQELLIWELGDKDDIVTPLALTREIMARKLLKQTKGLLTEQTGNFNFIMAMLIAGIYYLVLHKDKSTFCDMDLNMKADRDEFMRNIEWFVDLIFDKRETIIKIEQIAIDAYKTGVEPENIAQFTKIPIERIKELIA